MSYQTVHQQLSAKVRDILPRHIERLTWSREKIEVFQEKQLRVLLHHVNRHSPYYRRVLKGHDIDKMTVSDLSTLPMLTKSEVLEHWDDIICVKDLDKATAESHLKMLRDNPQANVFYNDQYYITATGGSSGLRGCYVWDLDCLAEITAVDFRYQVRDELQKEGFMPRVVAVLTAPSAIHASTPLCTTQLDSRDKMVHCIITDAMQDLCEQLNALQPTHLIGYASVIARLAREQRYGTLRIAPLRVTTNSEPLDDRARETILNAWGVQANNTWGSVEMGIAGIEDDRHQGLILSEDMIVFEPADRKLIITNLFNKALPLIRYVVDDVVEIKKASFTDYQITPTVEGRTNDWFFYDGHVEVHPMIFWNILEQEANIREYQVVQTPKGAQIRVVTFKDLETVRIQEKLEAALKEVGLSQPEIVLERVKAIARHEETAKLRRFIPLA
ncbi:MAG: hypothetical protein NXI01_05220 [Gammaproteobacteria bacterium]|nr:hypothetical protein [Gammaproteobacteria bacterium]